MNPSVVVSAPASIANLGPGFDVFALALEEPRDEVRATLSEKMEISGISGLGGIPRDPHKNSVTLAAERVFKLAGSDRGLEVSIDKGIEVEKGLGSSGASAAAGAAAANFLLGAPLGEPELIEAAGRAEGATSGSIHYDNVTAAILGGFVIIGTSHPPKYKSLRVPRMKIVIASPESRAPTKEGRELLPDEVSLRDSVANVERASLMVYALEEGELDLFAGQMVDSIVEPVRASRMPGIERAKRAAIEAGALGSAMAGAGPSVYAILESRSETKEIEKAMREAFESEDQACRVFVTRPGPGLTMEPER